MWTRGAYYSDVHEKGQGGYIRGVHPLSKRNAIVNRGELVERCRNMSRYLVHKEGTGVG